MGSSASTSRGRATSARAMAARCISPPDSSPGRWPARCPMPTRSSRSRTRSPGFRPPPRRPAPSSSSGSSTFSATDRLGSRWKNWNTNPTSRRRSRARSRRDRRADVAPVEADLPGVGHVEPPGEVQQRRLPRPRGAHERHGLALVDGQVDPVEGHDVLGRPPVVLDHPVEFQQHSPPLVAHVVPPRRPAATRAGAAGPPEGRRHAKPPAPPTSPRPSPAPRRAPWTHLPPGAAIPSTRLGRAEVRRRRPRR